MRSVVVVIVVTLKTITCQKNVEVRMVVVVIIAVVSRLGQPPLVRETSM